MDRNQLTDTSTSAAPTFFLVLEDDPIKNHELGLDDDDLLEAVPNLQAGDEQGPGSYLSLVCSSIQIVKPGRVLLVWRASFHPGLGRRFRVAVLTLKFSGASEIQKSLTIVGHAPRKAFGGCSKESRNVHWGIELPLTFPSGPASAKVSPSGSLDTAKDVEHVFTITGTARGVPKKTTCVWTVEENKSSRRGIASEIQFATILDYDRPFLCEVNVSARTGGRLSRWLKTPAETEGRQRPIDPAEYAGRLTEYDFGSEPGKCDQMLLKWSGEVEGAVLEFLQPVVRA